LEHRAAERDRARGDHQDVAHLPVQRGDVGGERGEPGLLYATRVGVDEQRRSDLDDDAAEVRQGGEFARHFRLFRRHVSHSEGAIATAGTSRAPPHESVMEKMFIGTSGWTYDGWRGPFYPPDVPKKDWLRWYAGRFPTAEINGSFYRTPSLEAVRAWRDQTPKDFVFAWKGSKFITHWKRLSEKSDNSIALIEERLKILGRKAGPVLFQLPARFTADRERLGSFFRMLPRRRRYAFEFRHASWYEAPIFDLLR